MIINRQRRVPVAMTALRQFLVSVEMALDLPKDAITVCLVSEPVMADLNGRFRGKDAPTDVLSFPVHSRKIGTRGIKGRRAGSAAHPASNHGSFAAALGDIAIAPDVARRNARRFGRSLNEELRILILHGALHLLGYDHETDHGEMERRERALRRHLGLA